MDGARTLRSGFLRARERFPDRPALEFDGAVRSYRELHEEAARIAATLAEHAPAEEGPVLTAVFGHRSTTAFAGILGALLRGTGYVPINPAFPPERSRAMLERSGCRALVLDATALRVLDAVLEGQQDGLVLLFPDEPEVAEIAARFPQHVVLGRADLAPAEGLRASEPEPDDIAYLLFTSGSTGQPKGVMVAHRNVVAFVDAMVDRYGVDENDRFSQLFDLTFDLSVFDMFVAWERGACLCVPTQKQKMMPGSYVGDARLTVWFSVPSTAVVLSKLRKLDEGAYPGLRLGLFCGEALPCDLLEAFGRAAPRAILENLYGPTELTIACTLYRFDPERSPAEAELGLVPIGSPYPGMEVRVVDESLAEVAPGETGELLMTGPQLTLGYWQDAEKTAAAFVTLPGGDPRTFYRTGDRVRRPVDDAPLVYLGRVDNQIKIQGYRVELGEIEAILREAAGVDVAIAIGWPLNPSGADGVVAFLGATELDLDGVKRVCRERLPAYMLPRDFHLVDEFPLNANGKVDRKALQARLGG